MSSFPYVAEEGFEAGTKGIFDTETDTAGIIDFPHFSELSRYGIAPYRGAYAMRARLTGGTTSGYVIETGSADISADGTLFVGFYFYLAPDFTMADTDKLMLFDLESTLNTTSEVALGILRSGANIQLWVAETAAATAEVTSIGTLDAPGNPNSCKGKWHHVALSVVLDDGGSNDGTIDAYWNGVQIGAQITSLDQAAVVDGRLGAIGPDAGTKGTILFDEFTIDDARLYPHKERFPNHFTVTKSQHIFVGPGHISSASLLTIGNDDILTLWDTDVANTDDDTGYVARLEGDVQTSLEGPVYFERGCYVTISGTNPLGQVILVTNSDAAGVKGPLNYSERGMVEYGRKRKSKSYGI
jgi:hypothetical protein